MTLPVFAVRELHGPAQHGIVKITNSQYDSTVQSYPNAALTYIDSDDGEMVTVGSGLELEQRLNEPIESGRPRHRTAPAVLPSPSDLKLHIFDIQRTTSNLAIWSDHAAYSSKTSSSARELGRQSSQSTHPPPPLAVAAPTSAVTATLTRPPVPPFPASTQDEVLHTLDQVLQAACHGLEHHIGGLASFIDMTASALQSAAQKTRDADTTPVETFLTGMKNVLVEAGEMGKELLREFEPKPQQTSISPAASQASAAPSTVSFREPVPSKPPSKVLQANFAAPPIRVDLSEPRAKIPVQADAKIHFRNSPNRPSTMTSTERYKPASSSSLMDEDVASADFSVRYPPLSSLKRAKTIGSLRPSTQTSERSELPKGDGAIPRPVRITPNVSAQHPNPTKARPLSFGGYQLEDLSSSEDEPQTASNKGRRDSAGILPGVWVGPKPSVADASYYESSGEFFNRMAADNQTARVTPKYVSPPFSCRNTSPPFDPFGPPTGLRRAQTVTAANPAARLNGPFDPLVPAPKPVDAANGQSTIVPRRSLTQHHPNTAPMPLDQPSMVNSQQSILPWHPTPHSRTMRLGNRGLPQRGPWNRPLMPGAFPYPPVPQLNTNIQTVRPMRSEPNFGQRTKVDMDVDTCIARLRNMGYGVGNGNGNEEARIPVYAAATAGDLEEAIDMIEEDRRAARDMMS